MIARDIRNITRFLPGILLVLVLLVLPFVYHDQYVYQIAILTGMYMILTMAMNLMLGQTGLVMLGQAGFYGLGAYVAALLALNLHWPFVATFLAGGVAAGLAALIVGFPSLKLKGIYFALVTMSLAEILRSIETIWISLTRGPMGLPGIPRPNLLGIEFSSRNEPYFFLVVLFVVAAFLFFRWLERSNLGLSLRAVRDDEVGASSAGIHVFRGRMVAFVIGCFITGLVGAFYAHLYTYVGPSSFTWDQSLLVLTMSMLGSFGGLPGCLIASIVLTMAPEILRPLALYRQVFFGAMLILLVVFSPALSTCRIGRKRRDIAQHRTEA